ncbi:2-oxo acid dehydrogenase subunit E2 [Labrys wisconsinensis]|uniref:Pyruvate dehydrogenase E2 component (Dihydrolipoamide acetyltransferase) n=1 Tax=Labrys wisconsinensis TaxID=425677 RepID=A0ABU0JAV2_9HYPH|nr:2-oxo acid dehydrogenase subunit E2 [Labrys wisconsinensis]MDQ0471402.1 pyruvate dehydrogenase E2 component (dihydrolipoamide acetyltransferase) [Labrys wisconsinensis]
MTAPIASPSTRQRAREAGVNLAALAAELGRDAISPGDLDDHLGAGRRERAADDHQRYWDIDHSLYGPIREEATSRFSQVAAANLSAAQRVIPAVTHHDRVDMAAVEAVRARLKDEASRRGVKLTALAFHMKALARTLADFPRFNASLSADGRTLFLKQYVHIGIAVDTPHGLMVPVIRDVDGKGLWQIAAEIGDLATRAQQRKLGAGESGGASMSISNLGGIGGIGFTPVVNPPEVAILGLSKMEIVPVWNGENFVPTPMTPLDLSYDHRVVNGADAARLLVRYAHLLADPRRLLI